MTNLELHPRHRVNSTGSRILIVIFSLVALGFTAVAWTMDISTNARAGAWRDVDDLIAAMIGSLGLGLAFSAMMLARAGWKSSNQPGTSATWLLMLSVVALISPMPGIVHPIMNAPSDIPYLLMMSLLAAIPLSGLGIGLVAWMSGASRGWVVGGLVFTPACITAYVFLIN